MPDQMTPVPTSQDLEVTNPLTGEVLNVKDAPTDVLGEALEHLRLVGQEVQSFRRRVVDEVLERMDREATWTVELPTGHKLTGQSPALRDVEDPQKLWVALGRLVAEGVITREAVDAAIGTKVEWTVSAAGLNKLRKIDAAAQVIREHEVLRTKPRNVQIVQPDHARGR